MGDVNGVTGSNLDEVFSEALTDVPRRRGRWIGPLIVVLVLLAAAFGVAEWIGRMMLTSAINAGISQAGVDLTEDAKVSVPGLLLPQLATGSVDELTVEAEGAELEGVTADVGITATGVSVLGRTADAMTLVARVDADGIEDLLAKAGEGSPLAGLADSADVAVAAPDVTISGELSVFGQAIPLAFDVEPSASDGELGLAPRAVRIADAEARLDQGDALPHGAPSFLSGTIPVCLASSLPAGAALADAAVEDDRLVLTFDVDGGILMEPSLRARGTC